MLYTTLGLLALGLVNTQAAPLQQQGEQAQIKHRAVSRVARRFARADGLIDFGQVEADAQRTRSKYAKSSALYKRQLAEREADPYAFLNEVARRQEEQRFGKRAPADNYAIVPLGATFSQGSIVGYRSNVSVGTPAQELTVVFDTGSPDFWLPGPNSGENVFKDFDPSQSSTAKDLNGQFVEQYGLGAVSGGIYSDVVSVSNLTVENQAFGVADQTTSNFNQPLGSAGLLGMSFNVLSVSFAGNNWIQNLVFNNKVCLYYTLLRFPILHLGPCKDKAKQNLVASACVTSLQYVAWCSPRPRLEPIGFRHRIWWGRIMPRLCRFKSVFRFLCLHAACVSWCVQLCDFFECKYVG